MKKSLLFLLLCTFGLQAQNFWTEVAPFPINPNYVPSKISIVDDNVVWIYGQDGVSLSYKWSRSVDGGLTWAEGDIILPSIELGVGSIYAVSETTAYVSVFPTSPAVSGGIWITQDGGVTWTQQTTAFGPNSFPNFIHFWDSNTGIAVGDPQGTPPNATFEIFITADSGVTWTQVPAANIPAPLDGEYGYTGHYEARGNTFWFGTNKGRILRSTDQGMNWMPIQSPVSDFGGASYSGNFAFRNENEGLLISSDWMAFRTSDGGIGWNAEIPEGILRNFNVVYVPNTNNAYFSWGENQATGFRGSSYTINGGYDWIDLDTDPQPVEPIEAKFYSGTTGFCIGRYLNGGSSDTKFFKLTDPLFRLLENKEFISGSPFSVYPNPTNGLVKISGEVINSITIFDISGKEVFSNVYQSLDSIEIDVSHFQNGIYVAKVSSSSGSSSTVKIIKN